ncbi:Y-family DNA polymerase [Rhizobium tumorigenes]|uniref:Y-family DNA polymerase n=1 Tax=Rhizobium tumorigenes TaxID=2041385 RepID=UPI00241CF09F|nr:DNA polymerase Y family protein [Rhizobium tumorigenes]WFS02910.1 DNA polymerase Y family protein [Rhizobium tumorigenes]
MPLSNGQQRILALTFPRLSTDRIARKRWGLSWRTTGRPETPPLVCAGRVKNAMRLIALEAAAEGIGLKPGQGVAEARAICPDLDVVEEDDAADRRLLEAMADWCDRYTPLVSLDGRDGLFLDITGCAHLFGGERALLKDVLHRLFHLGLEVRGAISSSPGLSWAVARFGRSGIVEADEMETVLAPLPVASLRLDGPTVAALQKLGLKQVGDIISAARAPLARRFGAHLLLRLDQALGLDEEPISPRRPVASLSAERRLTEPVQAEEDILMLAGQLGAALKPGLEARGIGGRLFELLLFRVDGAVFRISAGASKPLREPKRIAALFSERIKAVHDDLDAGFGYEIVRLNVLQHEIFDALQADFTADGPTEQSLSAFVDQVAARLGRACLQALELAESHVPERAALFVPAADVLSDKPRQTTGPTVGAGRSERPLRLFRTPEPVETFMAEVPEGPPQRFRWRRTMHEVLRAEGPERLAREWWLDGEAAPPRDYFRLEVQSGHRFWMFREGLYGQGAPPRWLMHGVFA